MWVGRFRIQIKSETSSISTFTVGKILNTKSSRCSMLSKIWLGPRFHILYYFFLMEQSKLRKNIQTVSAIGAWTCCMESASDIGSLMCSDCEFAWYTQIKCTILAQQDCGTHIKSYASEPVTFNRSVIFSAWPSSYILTKLK